jgi:hypothetical protein
MSEKNVGKNDLRVWPERRQLAGNRLILKQILPDEF